MRAASEKAPADGQSMKVAVDEVSPVKRTLRVEVSPDVVRQEFVHAYHELNRRLRLPGFRPGKVPRELLKQRYAKQVEDDIVRKLVPDYYQRAIDEAGLQPIELPNIDQVQVSEGSALFFSATVEIKPPITLNPYRGLTVAPVSVMVTDVEVNEALAQVQERFAQLESYEADRLVSHQDYVELDVVGAIDGKPLPGSEVKGGQFEVGKGVLLPEIEEAVLGQRAGDSINVQIKLGGDVQPEHRGKEVLLTVTIQSVKRKHLPKIDDELAKDAGAESLAALRQRLRAELEKQRRLEADATRKQELMKQLVATHQFAVPQTLVDRELGRLYSRVHPHRHEEKHDTSPTQEELQQFRTTYEPMAVERVKGVLLLEAIAADAKLTVSDDEVDAELRTLAAQMKVAPDQLRQLLVRQEGSLERVRRQLVEQKALDLVLAETKVEAT